MSRLTAQTIQTALSDVTVVTSDQPHYSAHEWMVRHLPDAGKLECGNGSNGRHRGFRRSR